LDLAIRLGRRRQRYFCATIHGMKEINKKAVQDVSLQTAIQQLLYRQFGE